MEGNGPDLSRVVPLGDCCVVGSPLSSASTSSTVLGEVSHENVILATCTRYTIDRIVFDKIDRTRILTSHTRTFLFVHPAFAKGDGS